MVDKETKAVVEKARVLAERSPDDPQLKLVSKAFEEEWQLRQATAETFDRSFENLHKKLSLCDETKTSVQQSIF